MLAERIAAEHRARIRQLAAERLANHHAIEVWEGPTCVLRMRRSGAAGDGKA